MVKNPILVWSGFVVLALAVVFSIVSFFDHRQVMGVNLWIKPVKFFLSIGIFNLTMAWYLSLLPEGRKTAIRWYSWMVVIVFSIELIIITGQAARGQLSHFNVSTPLNGALFSLMGIAINTLTVWTFVAGTWFWRHPAPVGFPEGFWWGIRMGIILFVVFSFQGMLMASNLQHGVGGADGGKGLPLVNWSTDHGDLRVSHFVGIHALQVLPILGFFLLRRRAEIIAGAILYGSLAVWLFLRAMDAKPLFG